MKRHELIKALREICDKVALNRKQMLSVSDFCYSHYGIPQNETLDVINDRISFDTKTDDFLFFISSGLSHCISEFKIKIYFNDEEIKENENKKYTIQGEYPVIIPCIPVIPGKQWIGAVDARFFLELDRNHKINYNYEKQRVRQKIIKGDEIYYRTKISMKSVKQICKLMQNGEYISDYLTLDIPYENTLNDFYYDEIKRELVFKNLDSFDITDGYHRLEAMRMCYSSDKNFNYPMGIQITQFSLQKTQQFIYQADQKNKMAVSQTNSYNSLRYSNEVCNFLNEDGGCVYNRMIKRSGNNTLDYIALSDIIDYFYFGAGREDKKKEYDKGEVVKTVNEVKGMLNTYASEIPDSLNRNIGFQELILYFYYIKLKKMPPEIAAQNVNTNIKNGKIKGIKLRGVRKTLFEQIDSLNL